MAIVNYRMTSPKVIPLKLETYLAVIKNSVDTCMFRNFYALVNGKRADIMRRGDLSCAFFVSFVLTGFSLINEVHGTVDGTVRDLESSGWKRIRMPRHGCVIVWKPAVDEKGESHKHIGFYIGKGKAISNDYKKGVPRLHPYHSRKVAALYWNPVLK
jgi:hypothetical protein